MDDLRFCPEGCCRFINNLPVNNVEYDSVPRPIVGPSVVEALIPCRRNLQTAQKTTEDAVGFYLGAPLKRFGGALLAVGSGPFVFDTSTDKYLREATDEDLKKWKEAWSHAVEAELERKKN